MDCTRRRRDPVGEVGDRAPPTPSWWPPPCARRFNAPEPHPPPQQRSINMPRSRIVTARFRPRSLPGCELAAHSRRTICQGLTGVCNRPMPRIVLPTTRIRGRAAPIPARQLRNEPDSGGVLTAASPVPCNPRNRQLGCFHPARSNVQIAGHRDCGSVIVDNDSLASYVVEIAGSLDTSSLGVRVAQSTRVWIPQASP